MKHAKTVRSSRQSRGAALLEAALVLPIALLFLLGILEYGRYLLVRQAADHACRSAARYAVVHTYDGTTADIQDEVRRLMAGLDSQIRSAAINVYKADPTDGSNIGTWTDAAFGETIAVQITGDYVPVAGRFLFMPESMPFNALAMMKSEAN
jgi:Flp pilus assembly protein TadG